MVTAFVLVGGLGTRLRPVVSDVPKPMAVVAGRPFLEHLLDYLQSQHVRNVVLCVGYLSEIIEKHFGSRYRGIRLSYSFDDGANGSGGAVSRALEKFPQQDSFLVCNGDTLFPIDTSMLFESARSVAWAIATFRTTDFGRYGSVSAKPDGTLKSLLTLPCPSNSNSPINANSGVWVGNPAKIPLPLLRSRHSYSLDEYLSQSLTRGTISAVSHGFDMSFIDIGLPADFRRAQHMPLFTGELD